MKPSAAALQHLAGIEAPAIDAREFRQGWRVRTRLDVLRDTGRITAGEYQAAVEYRSAWEAARLEVATTAQLMRSPGGGADAHTRMLAAVGAVAKLQAVEASIGRFAADLCRACIVRDLPWVEVARITGRNRETVRDWTVLAIRALARAWSGPRRRLAPRPVTDSGQRVARL